MNASNNFERYEQIGHRFLMALDSGDLDALGQLWVRAEADPELEKLFCELSLAYNEEVIEMTTEASIEIEIGSAADSGKHQPSLPQVRVESAPPWDLSIDPEASTSSRWGKKG